MNIADIARMAGVSNAAVSRYFNNGYISDEKREAIRKVVEETGYRPSVQAQTLRTKKTKTIGVIIPKIASSSIGSVVGGILKVLNENHYQMLLADTSNNPKKELEYLNVFKDKHVDGVILLATVMTAEHKRLLKEMRVPVVIIGQKVAGFCCVYHDDYHCMYDMCRLFIDKGCRKLGFISAPHYDRAAGFARHEGVSDAIRDEKEPIDFYEVIGDFNKESGYRMAGELLKQCPDLDGIICATDTICLGALQYLKEHNYSIPKDLLLSGHGNYMYTDVTEPTITTVQFSYEESGVDGAEMLLEMLLKKSTTVKEVMMGYALKEKGSTRK